MNRILSIIPTVVFCSMFKLFAQVNEFVHPAILSFEKDVFPVQVDEGSVVLVSDERFKHGKQSLHWKWDNVGDSWRIKQPIPYAKLNPHGDNSVATFVFWVYAPQTYTEGKLLFSFYKNQKLCSWFEYKLDFRGWSGAWVAFDRDMQGRPEEGMDELRVTIQGVERGELYFDHLILSSFQDVRHHTADFQAPFINAGTTNHWLTLLDSWRDTFDLPVPEKISSQQLFDIKTIEERFISIITEKNKPVPLRKLVKTYEAYRIRYGRDNHISGLPVFFERYGETYERMGAKSYKLLYANEMGVSNLNRLMFNLAVGYRETVDAKEKEIIASMYVDLTRHMLDQGFRAGSAMGTLHHLGYSMRLYYVAAILMRDVLREFDLDQPVQQAMEWFAGTGEVKHRPRIPGMDVDAFNTSLTGRLAGILMLKDSPEKVRYLQAFTRWIDNGLQYAEGTSGTFKIDGSMFHHRHNYPAYSIGGLEGAVNAVWILHNTSFAIAQSGRENLKNALLAMRYYCNLTTWPLSLSGRHPDGEGKLIPRHYARLALSGTPDGKQAVDEELAAAYLRLLNDSITPEADRFVRMGILPEKSPEGNRAFPYSSLSVHRRDNWMITAMGHSRYLWATETYIGANLYGRYLNHGQMQILATGNPVSNFESGFRQEGWDWNHFPGTTAAELPMKALQADIKNLDENSGYEELLLSDEAFAGAISVCDRHGIYAMKLHEHDKYNGSLRARKSFFFFDNRVIALGSNIVSYLPENEVHTTLFQTFLSLESKPLWLNGKPVETFPYYQTISKKITEISDGLNNHFFIKNASIHVKRSVQHSLHEETAQPTQNPFSLAYINHGKRPVDNRYEYMVLVQPDAKTLKSMQKLIRSESKQPYRVLKQDSMAHIVYDRLTATTGYVFFEAGYHTGKQHRIEVDIPCMVMTQTVSENKLYISVCDPDLRFYEGPADEQYDDKGKRIERSVYGRSWIDNPSKASRITITLSGKWKLAEQSEYIRIKSFSEGKTMLEVHCRHGLSREAVLISD